MMRIFGPETRQDYAAGIRFAGTFGVFEMEYFRAVGDVDAAIAGNYGRRDEQPFREDRALVGLADSLRVLQHVNLVVGNLLRRKLWIGFGSRAPEPAFGVPVDPDRLLDYRIGGE